MISQTRAMHGRPVRPKPGRGKPVRALLVILGGWVLVRAALWPSALVLQVVPPEILGPTSALGARTSAAVSAYVAGQTRGDGPALRMELPPVRPALDAPIRAPRISSETSAMSDAAFANLREPFFQRHIAGHILLLAAGVSNMELDPALLPFVQSAALRAAHLAEHTAAPLLPAPPERFASGTAHRWSMDAWALWRENDNSPLLSGRPSYGRSQVGTVVRFALVPSSGHAPQVFLRASAALTGAREEEGAIGVSARPLPFVPIRLAGEARLRSDARGSGTGPGTGTRLAAFAVSEFPPLALPGGTTGEVYVQGGYVTGRDATGFVDGQARITRDIMVGERFRLSAGGGVWGGAQDGAGRLDIGPTASLSFGAGGVFARISADYRFRVRGAAQPASGPALTISAGF